LINISTGAPPAAENVTNRNGHFIFVENAISPPVFAAATRFADIDERAPQLTPSLYGYAVSSPSAPFHATPAASLLAKPIFSLATPLMP